MYSFEVAEIKERIANTRNGPKPVFDLVGTDGRKYGMAFTNPSRSGISVGTVVNANGEEDKYGIKLDPKTISIGGKVTSGGAVAPAKSAGSPSSYGKVFPLPPTHGDTAIIRQNALTNAVATVADFIATQPTEKWPDLDKWTDMVIDTAYKFAEFSSGQREVKAIKKLHSVGMEADELNAAVRQHLGEAEEAA